MSIGQIKQFARKTARVCNAFRDHTCLAYLSASQLLLGGVAFSASLTALALMCVPSMKPVWESQYPSAFSIRNPRKNLHFSTRQHAAAFCKAAACMSRFTYRPPMSPFERSVMKISEFCRRNFISPCCRKPPAPAPSRQLKIWYHDKLRYPVAGAYLARMPLFEDGVVFQCTTLDFDNLIFCRACLFPPYAR